MCHNNIDCGLQVKPVVLQNEPYLQWRQIKNGCCMDGTLMFSSTGAYGKNYWIGYNLLEKEDMAV